MIAAKKCNGVLYNPRLQVCDNDELTSQLPCGSETYNISTQFCHNEQVYDLCGLTSYNPDKQECINGSVEYQYNIVYGSEKARLSNDEFYVVNKDGDTIAVDMGITSSKNGGKLYIATGNLIVRQDGSAYIPNDPGYIPASRFYSDKGGEWDLFGWADTSGRKTSTDLADYPSATPPTEISGIVRYDIATWKLGGSWRMPTGEELNNLADEGNSKITSRLLNKTNPGRLWNNSELGTTLFIPFAGDRYGTSSRHVGTDARLWSSTLNTSTTAAAYSLDVNATTTKQEENFHRYDGRTVRPVLEILEN